MPLDVLKEIFGFDSFRPGQEEVIRAVLEGRDTLAVMPTGGGKSLCYQVPALMSEGLTVIVSPLISLMKDQVDSLLQSSVGSAATLHSGLSPEERWEVERRIRSGEIRMLYVAPERLRSLEFVLTLRRTGVGLFVVDEAHCISEWGHDFRPDYLFLPRVVRDLGSPPVLALTATATPRVRQDIRRSLRMRDPEVVVTSFNRPNLTYRVVPVTDKKDKIPRILEVIRSSPPPGIVYGFSRKECEELAAGLRSAGVNAAHYHARLSPSERSSVQERFMTDEIDVVVATIAFGMGVDKANVRFVVHATAPGSLPNYIQEAGRAGRDGEPASCVVLYRGADLGRRKGFVTKDAAGVEEVGSFFRALSNVASEGRINVPPASLGSLGGVEPEVAGVLLGGLEETGLLSRGYDLWGGVEVRRVDEGPEGLREEVASVHSALPGEGEISVPELARRAGVRPVVAQTALFRLMVDGVVEALPRGSLADIRLKQGGLDGESRGEIAKRLKNRTRTSYKQIEHVEEYVNLSSCRRERLLRHFGDNEEVAPCAGCDFCLGELEDAVRALPEHTPAAASTAARTGIPAAHRSTRPAIEPNGATVPPPAAYDAELFERLRVWRGNQARSQQVPAYVVLNNSHIEEIARRKPQSVHELGTIKGIGLRRAARYGEDLLALVRGEDPAFADETGSPAASTASGSVGGSVDDSADDPVTGYRRHLEAAERHLRTGSGSAAVPELARALELGGEEAKRAVDDLLAP